MTEVKNSKCNQNSKAQLWQSSKTHIVTKLKKNQIVTKLKNSNFYKTQKVVKSTCRLDNRWDDLGAAFCYSHDVFDQTWKR